MSKKTYAMAIRDTLASEMERDERVFVMGEDVEVLGGIFGAILGVAIVWVISIVLKMSLPLSISM